MDRQQEEFDDDDSACLPMNKSEQAAFERGIQLGKQQAQVAMQPEIKKWRDKYEALKLKHDLILPITKDLEQQLTDCQAKLKRYEDAFNEPVAWIARHKLDDDRYQIPLIFTTLEEATRWKNQYKDGYAWLYELFTKPEGE
jgi:anaerobic selenocysteine-containing dehydrogenase